MKATTASLPAPVGGLNARDSLAEMEAKDAVILENWWPSTTDVAIRKGYANWSTGYGAAVETLFKYTSLAELPSCSRRPGRRSTTPPGRAPSGPLSFRA
jgi:hypothetical protein